MGPGTEVTRIVAQTSDVYELAEPDSVIETAIDVHA